MPVPDGVAYEAVTLYLARDRGELDQAALVAALSEIVGDLDTQADGFDLLTRIARMAANAISGWARELGTTPEGLIREAALDFADRERLPD